MWHTVVYRCHYGVGYIPVHLNVCDIHGLSLSLWGRIYIGTSKCMWHTGLSLSLWGGKNIPVLLNVCDIRGLSLSLWGRIYTGTSECMWHTWFIIVTMGSDIYQYILMYVTYVVYRSYYGVGYCMWHTGVYRCHCGVRYIPVHVDVCDIQGLSLSLWGRIYTGSY